MDYIELARNFRKEIEAMKFANRKLVKQVDLSNEELLELIDIYEDWSNLPVGHPIKEGEYYKYEGNLYEVVAGKSHNKQDDWKPTEASLFNRVQPPNVIPEWVQPLGAHDAYGKSAKVTHNGKDWESTVDNNTWEPGVHGWKEI